MLNLTSTNSTAAGFVTVYPCGQELPTSSNLNFAAGIDIANMVTAQLGVDGKVCLYSSAPTDLIVDAAGFFTSVNDFAAVGTPARLVDSRSGFGVR